MKQLEDILYLTAIGLYFAAWLTNFKPNAKNISFWMLTIGIVSHIVSISIRWIMIGHPPIFGSYEASLQSSWWLALFIATSYRSIFRYYRALVMVALPLAILIAIYGLGFTTERKPMTLSEFNYLVDFHALFSWLAYAPFTMAFALALVQLWQQRRWFKQKESDSEKATANRASDTDPLWPRPEIIDELIFRFIVYGFINHTIMFALGSYYSSTLFHRWWTWDPVESTSLVTWLLAGLYIHFRLFYNWRFKRAAWLTIILYATALFSYWGLIYLPHGSTFHVFDTETKAGH